MSIKFAINLSMQYTESAFLDRFARAAEAGFSAVEFHFPYDEGVEDIKIRIDDLGLSVVLFNLHAGDVIAGEWGTLGNPLRRKYFQWSFSTALEAAATLGCGRLNMMFGQQVPSLGLAAQIDCACENLAWAVPFAAAADVLMLIEPLNRIDFPQCALNHTATAVEIVKRLNHRQVKLLYDVYHAQMNEGNLIDTIIRHSSSIGHIQIADVPGRHEPGTGEIHYPTVFATLEKLEYDGFVGLEYRPSRETDESLSWLSMEDRA